MVGDDPPETLEDRSTGSNDACMRDTRSARGRFWHNGQVSRPYLFHPVWGQAPHGAEREPVGGPKESPRAPRPTGRRRRRVRGCGRSGCAVGVRATSARAPRDAIRAERPRRRAPRSCSRRRRRPVAPATAVAVAALGGGEAARAARASMTCGLRRRRPSSRRRRSCTSRPNADRTDRAGSIRSAVPRAQRSGAASRSRSPRVPHREPRGAPAAG